MKFLVVCVAFFLATVNADTKCQSNTIKDFPEAWKDMTVGCTNAVRNQIQEELKASMTYMAMGAYFSRADVNRPGFSKMFFDSANEEREHAMKLISYLLRRGELIKDVSTLIDTDLAAKEITQTEWTEGGLKAMKDALNLEAKVTQKIRGVIAACESSTNSKNEVYNDYELVDYLTGEFLDEQHKGQRDLAGKISVLGKMINEHKELGEFLFDKKLL